MYLFYLYNLWNLIVCILFFYFFYNRIHTNNDDVENITSSPKRTSPINNKFSTMLPSFIDADILKHLCRELDSDKVEAEFSIRVRS